MTSTKPLRNFLNWFLQFAAVCQERDWKARHRKECNRLAAQNVEEEEEEDDVDDDDMEDDNDDVSDEEDWEAEDIDEADVALLGL